MSDNNRKVVHAIIAFLNSQLNSGNMTEDACESLDVAIQCLESAYEVSVIPPQPATLAEIFEHYYSEHAVAKIPEASPAAKVEAEQLKNNGNQFMKEGKHDRALDCYTSAIKLDGRNAVYYCNRAAAYSKMGNHAASISDCKMAIHLDPTYGKAYGRLGLAYTSIDDHSNALLMYQKALGVDPDNCSYQTNLRLTEEKLAQARANNATGQMPLDFPELSANLVSVLGNPELMTMINHLMADPGSRVMMNTMLSPNPEQAGNPGSMDFLLNAGQQLAAGLQHWNPTLYDDLRRQFNPPDEDGPPLPPPSDNEPPPPPPSNNEPPPPPADDGPSPPPSDPNVKNED